MGDGKPDDAKVHAAPPPDAEGRRMMYVDLRTEEFPCMGDLCVPDEKDGPEDGDAPQGAGGAVP